MNYLSSLCCFCRCRNKTLPYKPSADIDSNPLSSPPNPLSQTEKPSNAASAVNSAAQSPFTQIPAPPIIELRSKSFAIPSSVLTKQIQTVQEEATILRNTHLNSASNNFDPLEKEMNQKDLNENSKGATESTEKANAEKNNDHSAEDNEVYTLNHDALSDERAFINSEIQEQIKREQARLFQRDMQFQPNLFVPFQPFSRPPSELDNQVSRTISIIHPGLASRPPSQISKNKIPEFSRGTDDSISPVFSRDHSELDSHSHLHHSRQTSNETLPTMSNPVSRAHSLARFVSSIAEPPSAIRESQEIQDALSPSLSRESSLTEEGKEKEGIEKEGKEEKEGKKGDPSDRFHKKPPNDSHSIENSIVSAANSISPFGVKSEKTKSNSPAVQPRPKLSPGKSERIINRKGDQLLRNRERMHQHHSFSNLSL